MIKEEIINIILRQRNNTPLKKSVTVFSPSNIALCKYWGKRDQELNLPITSSLSISLGPKGTTTTLGLSDTARDIILLNGKEVDPESEFHRRLVKFLDLFRTKELFHFEVDTRSNIPTAAGLASSASGFAAMVTALQLLFDWKLSPQELSILARLGSGSACRSIWQGFVEWQKGERLDGMDSYGKPIETQWPELCIGLFILSKAQKEIDSRAAMLRTVETSPFYSVWPDKVERDLILFKRAIENKDFELLGTTAEANALAMHATMLSSWPPISYALPETIITMKKIWELRTQGLSLYFTQDAGPNLKLLFLQKDKEKVVSHFPTLEVLQPFLNGFHQKK